jgi:fibronectin-binding autotransporter adhesin
VRKSWRVSRLNCRGVGPRFARLVLAVAPVVGIFSVAKGQSLTWDSSGTSPTSPVDGSGNWNTTSALWSNGTTDADWVNGDSAIFGHGGTAGTVTINTTGITAAGLTFNSVVSGSYTIAGESSSDKLTLAGGITLASGVSPTISAVIAGTDGLILTGTGGTLILTGTNTYTGDTFVTSGLLVVNSGNALNGGNNNLFIGPDSGTAGAATSSTGAVTFNATATVESITTTTNSAAANTLTINTGTLTSEGDLTVGPSSSSAATTTVLNVTGAGSLVVDGYVELGGANTAGNNSTATLNLSGLANFTQNNQGGNLDIGNGESIAGIMTLASASTSSSNHITVSTINLDTSENSNANAPSYLILGQGTNVLDVDAINFGYGKGAGEIEFISGAPATASVTIAGSGGGTTAAVLTLGEEVSGTASSDTSNLALAGHVANVNASWVTIGWSNGNTGGTARGAITFDTGTFNALEIDMGVDSFGSGTTGANGSFMLGSSATSTGVLSVTGNFVLAENINNNSSPGTATGIFTINGGTANIGGSILVPSTNGASNTTLQLLGGTLNMEGNSIGGSGNATSGNAAINTVSFVPSSSQSAILENLGGTGINGAGLNFTGAGTLILAGTNTYSGSTTIGTAGHLQLGSITLIGTLPTNGAIIDNGALTFAGGNTLTIGGAISGSSGFCVVNQNGTGTTFLTGTNTYTGQTNILAGTLSVEGQLYHTSSNSVNVSGGTLAGAGSVSGAVVTMNGGQILPDVSATSLRMGTLNMNGGTLQFGFNGASASSLSVTGNADLNSGTLALVPLTSPTLSSYTILTAGTLSNSLALTPVTYNRATLTPTVSGNSIVVNVTSGPALLQWIGANNGGIWDVQNTQNWQDVTYNISPDVFYNDDNVTFGATATSLNVNINSQVAPRSINVNSGASTYTFSGVGGIIGTTGVTLAAGSLVLSTSNSYTGATLIGGYLKLGAAGALPLGSAVGFGGQFAGSYILDINGFSPTIGSLYADTAAGTIGSSSASSNSTINWSLATPTTFIGVVQNTIGAGTKTTGLDLLSGSLILTGSNTYSGATTISAGSALQIGSGGTFGSVSSSTTIADNGLLVMDRSDTPTIGNNIGGTGALYQIGSGTVLLTGSNSYTGGTSVQQGTLRIGSANAFPAGTGLTLGTGQTAATIDLNGNNISVNSVANVNIPTADVITNTSSSADSTFTFSTGINNTFGGVITNGAAHKLNLTIDSGGLTLSNSNTYTGTTTIDGGALVLASTASLASPKIIAGDTVTSVSNGATLDVTAFGTNGWTLGATQTLAGESVVVGNVVTKSGSTLAPGNGDTGSTNFNGNLNAVAGTVLSYFFGTPDTQLSPSAGISSQINVTGTLTLPTSGTVTLNLNNNNNAGSQGSLGLGTYDLFNYGALAGGNGNFNSTFQVGTSPLSGDSYTFVDDTLDDQIDLDIVSGTTTNLIWTGSSDGKTWDVNTTPNWINQATGLTADFANTNNVTFNDANAGGHYAVTIAAGGVLPGTVTVASTSTYTFSGAGIGGSTALFVSGGGTLVLDNSNTYTGATTISGSSTLILGSGGSLADAVNVGGGTLRTAASATISGVVTLGDASNDSGMLDLDGNSATVGGLTTLGTGSMIVGNSANSLGTLIVNGSSTFAGVIQNTLNSSTGTSALTVANGTFVLNGVNTYTGATTINAGADLQVGNGSNATAQVGDATVSGSASSLVVDGTLSLDFNGNVSGTWEDTITGSGNITMLTNAHSLNFGGNVSGFTGQVTIGSGDRYQISGSGAPFSASLITIANGGGMFGSPTGTFSGNINLAGVGFDLDNSPANYGALRLSGATVFSGTVTLMGANNEINQDGGAITITGPILDGAGGSANLELTSNGGGAGGTLILGDSSNNWGGGTDIECGTVKLAANNALPAGGVVTLGTPASGNYGGTSVGHALVASAVGTLDLGGFNTTIGGLTNVGAGTSVVGNSSTSSPSTLTIAGGTSTFGGVLQNTIGSGTEPLALTVGSGSLILTGSNTYTGTTTVSNGASLVISAAGALPAGAGVANNGSLSILGNSSISQITGSGTLALGNGVNSTTVTLSGTNVVNTQAALTINGGTTAGSALNIGDNAVVLNYTGSSPEAAVQTLIENGMNASTTAGAIVSSFVTSNAGYGIAYADGSDSGLEDSNLLPGQVVIEPDHDGDTDLNGTVNIHDLQNLLSDFNAAGYWDEGNFNGHVTVDISDLTALLSNFNLSTSLTYSELDGIENLVGEFGDVAIANVDGRGFTLVAVPEPTGVMLMAAGVSLLARRRRA